MPFSTYCDKNRSYLVRFRVSESCILPFVYAGSPEATSNASSGKKGLSDSNSDIKDELIELVSGGFLTNSARKRALVTELLLKLEALNPTESPAYSPLLNGPWSFLYTGGISPGMLGTCGTIHVAKYLFASRFLAMHLTSTMPLAC